MSNDRRSVLNEDGSRRMQGAWQWGLCGFAALITVWLGSGFLWADAAAQETVNGIPGVALVTDAATGTILINATLNGKPVTLISTRVLVTRSSMPALTGCQRLNCRRPG